MGTDGNKDQIPEIGTAGHVNWDGFKSREIDKKLGEWLRKRGLAHDYKPYSVLGEFKRKKKK